MFNINVYDVKLNAFPISKQLMVIIFLSVPVEVDYHSTKKKIIKPNLCMVRRIKRERAIVS